MAIQLVKLPTKKQNLTLRVSRGHYVTNHSHTNYYIDVTLQKTRISEARAVAEELTSNYKTNMTGMIVDTILCLDGTEVIGTLMAEALENSGFESRNTHKTIYVVTPEHGSGSQLIFRENTQPMIQGKHVLILTASVTTGYTAKSAINAIRYYGGTPVGVSAIFAAMEFCENLPVVSIFDTDSFGDYRTYDAGECPLCKKLVKIDAMVNSYGYSSF